MVVIRDTNISGDLDEKLGKNVWWKPTLDKKTLKELCIKRSLPGIIYTSMYFIALILTGFLAYYTWGTYWTILWFWLYGTIYSFSGAYDHESRHRTLFKQRWLNELFQYIFSFMTNFEPVRWRWTHTLHHSYTLHTNEPLDFEIQVDRPSKLFKYFVSFLPFGPLLWIHQSYLAETLKNSLGIMTPAIDQCVPKEHQWKVFLSSRIHMLIWLIVICSAIYFWTILPILFLLLPTFYGNTLFALCGLTQHAGLAFDVKDHRVNARTVILNPILSWLYVKLEYHQEHHMFPQVPWYNLPKLHELIKDQMPKPNNGLISAYKDIIPTIIKQAYDPSFVPDRKIPKII